MRIIMKLIAVCLTGVLLVTANVQAVEMPKQQEPYVPIDLDPNSDDGLKEDGYAFVWDDNYVFEIYPQENRAVLTFARIAGKELTVPGSVAYKGKIYPITHFQTYDDLDWPQELPYQSVIFPDCVNYITLKGTWPHLNKIKLSSDMKEISTWGIDQRIQYVVPENMKYYDFKNNALYSKKNPGKLVYALNIPSEYTVADGTTHLARGSLSAAGACKYVEELTFPASLEEIPVAAFAVCYKLQKVDMSKSQVKILSKASFRNTKKLKKLSLPLSLECIEEKAFYGSGIAKLSIPGKVGTIGEEAFKSCKNLKSLTLEGKKKMPVFAKGSFRGARSGIRFYVKNRKMAKQLKKNLKGTMVKKAKIYVGKKKKLVYKNINA